MIVVTALKKNPVGTLLRPQVQKNDSGRLTPKNKPSDDDDDDDDDDEAELHVLGCRLTYLGTNCDQCRSTVQYCFTSTETVRLVRTESPGRPPRLSHSSRTLTKPLWSDWYYTGPRSSRSLRPDITVLANWA